MAPEDQENPVEQLIELLVYAPIGLLYEYQNVLPQLVRRGKSQVQLARLLGQAAANQGSASDVGATVADAASVVSSLVARLVTDIGAQVGLAPESPTPTPTQARPDAGSGSHERQSHNRAGEEDGAPDPEPAPLPLPIAGYDGLTAREIIPLLDDLDPAQQARIRTHESANRNRKTVLAKLDRLGS